MQLDKTFKDINVRDIKSDVKKVVGPHGIGTMKENGELFADFLNRWNTISTP